MQLLTFANHFVASFKDGKFGIFTATRITRIGLQRDPKTGKILYKLEENTGTTDDGFKDIDISYQAMKNGTCAVLFTRGEDVITDLSMTPEEVNDLGCVLAALHKTGFHIATTGVANQTTPKNVAMFITTNGKDWSAYNATARSGITDFQPLDDGKMAVRYADTLGPLDITQVVDAVVNNKPTAFKTHTMDIPPQGAVLAPRFANKNAELVMGYVDYEAKVTVTAELQKDGTLAVVTSVHKDDVVGKALPFACLDENGNVTKQFGLLAMDVDAAPGGMTLTTGMPWKSVFHAPAIGTDQHA